jgi:hypothetical protein
MNPTLLPPSFLLLHPHPYTPSHPITYTIAYLSLQSLPGSKKRKNTSNPTHYQQPSPRRKLLTSLYLSYLHTPFTKKKKEKKKHEAP